MTFLGSLQVLCVFNEVGLTWLDKPEPIPTLCKLWELSDSQHALCKYFCLEFQPVNMQVRIELKMEEDPYEDLWNSCFIHLPLCSTLHSILQSVATTDSPNSLSTSSTQQNHHVLLRSPHSLCLGLVGSPVILSLMSRHLFPFAHDHSLGMSIVPKS